MYLLPEDIFYFDISVFCKIELLDGIRRAGLLWLVDWKFP